MSAPVTKAHLALARDIMLDHTPGRSAETVGMRNAAQLIADSEAKAAAAIHHELNEARNAERLARVQLATEREKVRVLQEAMKFSANKDKYFQAQFDPCQRASAALAATEGKP